MTGGETIYWPSSSVLTARLRRLITASQRFTKSRQILHIHQTQSQSQPAMILSAPLCPLPPTFNDTLNPKMVAKIERQQRLVYIMGKKYQLCVRSSSALAVLLLGTGSERFLFKSLCQLGPLWCGLAAYQFGQVRAGHIRYARVLFLMMPQKCQFGINSRNADRRQQTCTETT